MEHHEYAQSLRLIADWVEAHPEVSCYFDDHVTLFAMDSPENAERAALAFKPFTKDFTGDIFYMRRRFGTLTLSLMFNRSSVCTKRVVGTEDVPERVIKAHTRELVEWDCLPILGSIGDVVGGFGTEPESERLPAPDRHAIQEG